MAKARAIERSLKLNNDDADPPISSPVAFVARQENDEADATTTPAAVKDFVRAVKKCESTESFVKLIDTYSRSICHKPVDVETVLICQDDKDINLSEMRRNILAEAKTASDLLPLVASIHHQLPTRCTKETFRSTRVTEEHDLKNVSNAGLKKLRRLKERTLRRDHSGSDDDMEDRPDKKKRRHAACDSLERINVLQEENASMKRV
jgi:hypothetical protein